MEWADGRRPSLGRQSGDQRPRWTPPANRS